MLLAAMLAMALVAVALVSTREAPQVVDDEAAAAEERQATEQAEAEQAAAEQAAAEQAIAAEQAAKEQAAAEERAAAAQQEAAEQAEAERIAAEQVAAEQAAIEQAIAEQAAIEQAAIEQAAIEQAAIEQAAIEQAAAEQQQLAVQRAAEEKRSDPPLVPVVEDALVAQGGEAAAVPPGDPTMFLSVPKLGISGALVAGGEAGLELGAMHLDGTGYPWQPGANTYIAGHRVGFPGTGSDHIFYGLPSMAAGDAVTLTDSLGRAYSYRVSEVFAVTPFDLWVTAPTGSDTVTLQVCTETPDDWWTIGPKLMESGPDSGRLIVRAERIA